MRREEGERREEGGGLPNVYYEFLNENVQILDMEYILNTVSEIILELH